jgi:hypothetical protein
MISKRAFQLIDKRAQFKESNFLRKIMVLAIWQNVVLRARASFCAIECPRPEAVNTWLLNSNHRFNTD